MGHVSSVCFVLLLVFFGFLLFLKVWVEVWWSEGPSHTA